jgi:hypothetical protein
LALRRQRRHTSHLESQLTSTSRSCRGAERLGQGGSPERYRPPPAQPECPADPCGPAQGARKPVALRGLHVRRIRLDGLRPLVPPLAPMM